ncbi:MAG: hypothetical protein QM756_03795 [Polyangiaceae bacterium]
MRWLCVPTLFAVPCFVTSLSCAERHPSAQAAPSQAVTTAPAAPVSVTPAAPAPVASAAPSASAPPVVAASAEPAPPAPEAEASLTGPDGKALPQTEERPRVDSAAFKARIERLANAILKDDPSSCLSSFFPLLAYREVKAVEKPERDYQYRLVRHFERDIHEYHKALGKGVASAKFDGVEVPEASARWMKPGSEGNKLGYFRVLRSRLRFLKEDGKTQTFELTSMISWRGEWYVVHLHGFE